MADCSCSSHGSFLTAKGFAEAAQRRDISAEIDGMAAKLYLDKVGSVSALAEAEDLYAHHSDEQIDNQYRRFLNGY